MKIGRRITTDIREKFNQGGVNLSLWISEKSMLIKESRVYRALSDQRGDVPGWVLVVLMTTGLVTAIWTIAAPRLTAILKNALDSMNGIR
jgi:hypothetical protein